MTNRDFWQAVYLAAIQAGRADHEAKQAADTGVSQGPAPQIETDREFHSIGDGFEADFPEKK